MTDLRDYGLSANMRPDDNRQAEWAEQRQNRGFDDTELWNLDSTFAKFMLPRLKAFREDCAGHPHNTTEIAWAAKIDNIIAALGIMSSGDLIKPDQAVVVDSGLDDFRECILGLWC